MTVWNAEKIRAELREGKKPFVVKSGKDYRNLSHAKAAMLEGEFTVEETPYEIVITDNFQRKPKPSAS